MRRSFELDHAKLAADPRYSELSAQLSAFSRIDSRESFNRYCSEACRLWPRPVGETEQFASMLEKLDIRTSWGGVVITLHEHPHVEKYLVVRQGRYLALEMHEQKNEHLQVREGTGLILWRPANEHALVVEALQPRSEFQFQPRVEHCVIGTQNLLVFERSTDPKGMDQDLIFIYEPDAG